MVYLEYIHQFLHHYHFQPLIHFDLAIKINKFVILKEMKYFIK